MTCCNKDSSLAFRLITPLESTFVQVWTKWLAIEPLKFIDNSAMHKTACSTLHSL